MTDEKKPNPQQIPATFPPPQRQTPVPMSTFRHQHKFERDSTGQKRCSCGLVVS